MKKKIAIIASVILLGVVVGFRHEIVPQACEGGTQAEVGAAEVASPIKLPQLTEAEKARAIEIALNDPRVQELLKGKNYVVAPEGPVGPRIGLWHEGERKLGVAMDIVFDKQYLVEGDWLIHAGNNRIQSQEGHRQYRHHIQPGASEKNGHSL